MAWRGDEVGTFPPGCSYDIASPSIRMIRSLILFLTVCCVMAGMAPSTPPKLPENVRVLCFCHFFHFRFVAAP